MAAEGARYSATIPAEYTGTEFPLEYFFLIEEAGGATHLYPGFTEERTNQPYYVIRSA